MELYPNSHFKGSYLLSLKCRSFWKVKSYLEQGRGGLPFPAGWQPPQRGFCWVWAATFCCSTASQQIQFYRWLPTSCKIDWRICVMSAWQASSWRPREEAGEATQSRDFWCQDSFSVGVSQDSGSLEEAHPHQRSSNYALSLPTGMLALFQDWVFL